MAEQDTTSFWTEIKRFEDVLAKDPRSYCFAPLAELYRKLGLLDDAVAVAKKGVEIHPDYVGGQMALGRAYFDKGERQRSREALEKVVRVTPDNLLAQRLVSQLYLEAGDLAAAENTLGVILSLNPDDVESRLMLESLARTAQRAAAPAVTAPPEQAWGDVAPELLTSEIAEEEEGVLELDEADILEEIEILEEDESLAEEELTVLLLPDETEEAPERLLEVLPEPPPVAAVVVDEPAPAAPFATATMAELFAAQGFTDRARNIYQELLAVEPDNAAYRQRLAELAMPAGQPAVAAQESPLIPSPPQESVPAWPEEARTEMSPAAPAGEQVLATYNRWLDSIEERRRCHSAKR